MNLFVRLNKDDIENNKVNLWCIMYGVWCMVYVQWHVSDVDSLRERLKKKIN